MLWLQNLSKNDGYNKAGCQHHGEELKYIAYNPERVCEEEEFSDSAALNKMAHFLWLLVLFDCNNPKDFKNKLIPSRSLQEFVK
jgi:hypothetical protein